MRAAAGTDVRAGDRYDAHLSGQLLFAAVGDGFERLGVRIRDLDRDVFPDPFVGLGLDGGQVFLRQHAGKIDGHKVRAHVKADVFIAEAAVDDAGENMLAGMQLHEFKSPVIVDPALDALPLGKRLGAKMHDLIAALVRVGHADAG